MTRRVAIIGVGALTIAAAACGGKKAPIVQPPTVVEVLKPVVVKEPVAVALEAPPELLAPFTAPAPVFIAPTDPLASSALTVEQERAWRAWAFERVNRILAWEAWYRAQMAKLAAPQPP